MSNNSKQREPEITDQQQIQQSLRLLDQAISWFWWKTIAMAILLLAALAALSAQQLSGWFATQQQRNVTVIVGGLLMLLSISNGYALYRQHHFKVFRKHLAEQMQVTEKQRLRADKFYGLAILDPLTGLYNRRFGEESLQKEIMRAQRNNYNLAVIIMDLDNFKEINDRFGHAAGDLVLKEFSRNLKRTIRECDVPIRMGGDEFLVVLPECPKTNVQLILSRLGPFEVMLDRQKITVFYSRGSAQYQAGDTLQTIVQRADESMYAEKADRATPAV